MRKTDYQFEQLPDGSFKFFIDSVLQVTFSRSTFRDSFEALSITLGFSSKWVGCMLRKFRREFPLPFSRKPVRSDLDRLIALLGSEGIAAYFRSKGFRVVKKVSVPDRVLIRYLEKEGYELDGILDNDVPYSSRCEVSHG